MEDFVGKAFENRELLDIQQTAWFYTANERTYSELYTACTHMFLPYPHGALPV